jgi:ATPase subunit of ABC transporter with duplicated ATPase domains
MEVNLLRTILIIFIISYVIKLFTRYIMPALFYNYMDDKAKEFSQQQKRRQREQQQARKREGEVFIDYTPQGNSKNKPSKGDYVDYEEVK